MYPSFGGTVINALVAYGSLSLTDQSPPQSFVEPISTAEMIAFLRFPNGFTATELPAMITAARVQAEAAQNRDLVVKQWDLVNDYWPGYAIEIRGPLISFDLMRYKDSTGTLTTLTENVDYIVDKSKQPAIITPLFNKVWPTFTPWPSSALLFRFTSGLTANSPWWSGIGADVKHGMMLLVKYWFNRESPSDRDMQAIDRLLSSGAVSRNR